MKTVSNSIFKLLNSKLGLIDIGASGGLGGDWKPYREHLVVTGFEPHRPSYNALVKSKQMDLVICGALYEKRSEIDFHITKKQHVSSIYKPNKAFLKDFRKPERFDIIRTVKMQADTLDFFLSDHKVDSCDFIKIDTQGSELNILRGGVNILSKAFGVRTEVEYEELYVNQPLEPEVDSFLQKEGFELIYKICTRWTGPNGKYVLVGGDSIYIRKLNRIKEMLNMSLDKRNDALKILAICSLYMPTDKFNIKLNELSNYLEHVDLTIIKASVTNAKPKHGSIRFIDI